jgi:hypothetical protein
MYYFHCRYAGRFDCGCVYEMKCELLNEREEPLTDFKCRESIEQWEGGAWHKVRYLTNICGACYGSSDHPTF